MADKFDWNQFPVAEAKPQGGFDWNQFEAVQPTKPAEPEISKTESAARGAAQSASLGFSDEITGAAEALWEKAKGDPTEFGKLYKQYRDESRANNEAAEKANPKSYLAGEVGGAVATAFVPGMNIAKGASLAKVAGQAALMGGAAGAGYSKEEDLAGVAKDAGRGAALGAVTGVAAAKAAPYVGKALGAVGEKAKSSAEKFAARALGAERATVKRLGQEKILAAGRQALDEGIITPLASTDDMIARNSAVQARGGEQMGKVYQAIDDAGASTFNPFEVASKVDNEIGGFYRSPINKGETRQLENTLESIVMRGSQDLPLQEAQVLKQELGKVANWKNTTNITDKEKMARDAYRIVSDKIDEATEKGAELIGNKDIKGLLDKGKKLFGNSKIAQELLENKRAREEGNKLLGITDWGLLGGSAPVAVMTGGSSVVPTVAALGAKKGLERYGSQNAALLLDKAGKVLSKTAPAIERAATNNPGAVSNAGRQLLRPESTITPRKIGDEEAPKGETKWAKDGLKKLQESFPEASLPPELLNDKEARKLLIAASDLKPGSKAMNKIMERIKRGPSSTTP